jgi:hypothetical protein
MPTAQIGFLISEHFPMQAFGRNQKVIEKNGAYPLMCLFPNKHRKEKRHEKLYR